jgi:hypothetical protein
MVLHNCSILISRTIPNSLSISSNNLGTPKRKKIRRQNANEIKLQHTKELVESFIFQFLILPSTKSVSSRKSKTKSHTGTKGSNESEL